MTDIIFSMDTENFVCPAGADGILRTARILREENVRGCFLLVGRLVEALEKWGRQDVIEELKYHELGTHTLAHSYHPMVNEYTDLEDYEAAREIFLEQEKECLAIVRRVFGERTFYACCPTSSARYVARYGYAELGQSVCAGDMHVFDEGRGRPVSCCNLLCARYGYTVEFTLLQRTRRSSFGVSDSVRALSEEEIRAHLDRVAQKRDLCIYCHHPDMGIYDEWWDLLNFHNDNTPPDRWKESIRLPKEISDQYYENFRTLVRLIKKDPRFRIITYETLTAEHSERRVVSREDLPVLKAQLEEDFFPVTLPHSYCLSDLFLACREMLLGKEEHECGFVYGFLEEPFAVSAPVTVTKEEMIASAGAVSVDGWLPLQIRVGEQILGPADWLRAALAVLCGEDTVTVLPDVWQIDMGQFPVLRDKDLVPSVYTDYLQDNHLSRRDRLQTWTIRLPKGTSRKIF